MPTPPQNADAATHIAKATRLAAVVDGLPAAPSRLRPVLSVGVIGAGTMGGGIAMTFASAGIPVTLVETAPEALDRGVSIVRRNYQASADKGRFPQSEVETRMARLTPALDIAALADCDLIIEAVFENMDLKTRIFARLDSIAKDGAILATNTSALDIDQIAAATRRPQDVIGLHFFSPANVMKLLEIVRAEQTADDVVATCMDLAGRIGKVPVLVGVCDGFVGNRMLAARREQANRLLFGGLMPWDIDAAITGFGFKMGPYQMSDLAGLDIGWTTGAKTHSPIRDALCEMGRRGQKTGAGFYDYDDQRRATPSDVTARLIRKMTGAAPTTLPPDEIVETLLAPMVNEAVRILEENKAQRPSDIDVVWLNGYGFPPDKGGPMFWADRIGAGPLLARMERLAKDDPACAPAPTLRRLAQEGGSFLDLNLGGLVTRRTPGAAVDP